MTWTAALLGLFLIAPAAAQDNGKAVKKRPAPKTTAPAPAPAESAPAESTRPEPPPLPSTPRSPVGTFKNDTSLTIEEATSRPFPNTAYIGSEILGLDPQYVFEVQRGLEKLYLREYTGARDHFEAVDAAFPGTGVAAVNDILVWQALMLENFDFKFDKQYWVSSSRAREELDAALKAEGGDAWEHLLFCGVAGIESIHTMRQTQYTQALSLAFDAMGHLQEARESAPDFPDLLLADGMYNYWRTAVTMSSKVLPDFGDHRAEGIEQMKQVEASAIFLSAPTTLAMAFTWLEEGDLKQAMGSCQKNRRAYPNNIVNNLVTGTTYVSMRDPAKALEMFDKVLAVDPKNKRVRYWKGVALLKSDKAAEAEKEFRTYLDFDYMEKYQRAAAELRLGQALQKQKKFGEAYAMYQQAHKSGSKGAKPAMQKLDERKKAGKIDF